MYVSKNLDLDFSISLNKELPPPQHRIQTTRLFVGQIQTHLKQQGGQHQETTGVNTAASAPLLDIPEQAPHPRFQQQVSPSNSKPL